MSAARTCRPPGSRRRIGGLPAEARAPDDLAGASAITGLSGPAAPWYVLLEGGRSPDPSKGARADRTKLAGGALIPTRLAVLPGRGIP